MSRSEPDSTTPTAEQVVEQMREATDRIRDKAWMVTAMTSTADLAEAAHESASS